MGKFLKGLKHAFAVETQSTDEDQELPDHLERLVRGIVERGLEIPAIVFLESVRPLNFLAGQSMIAAWPLVRLFAKTDDFEQVALSFEDRRTIGRLVKRLELLTRQKGAQ